MLDVTLSHRKQNEGVRHITMVRDVKTHATKVELLNHNTKQQGNRWNKLITQWIQTVGGGVHKRKRTARMT